ncbi:MAG: acyltransferase [Gammaproteobacteria bacterium]|nr:acyltransferase [Gammaproteobacteria bacterium]MCB1859988.1 acyltransferase [Gammaproteobacteria bacterium]
MMKARLKTWIESRPALKRIFLDWGLGSKIPLRLIAFNYIFALLSGQNHLGRYSVHYTSRLIAPERLILKGNGQGSVASLALSAGCYIQAGNGIEVGEGTIWASNVAIISANHGMGTAGVRDWDRSTASIVIGEHCWIGVNATILPGVELGPNTVVGAGSVVTRSFSEGNQVIAGNPARVIRVIV